MDVLLNLINLNIKIKGYPYKKLSRRLSPFELNSDVENIDIVFNVHSGNDDFDVSGEKIFSKDLHEVYYKDNKYTLMSVFRNADKNEKCYTVFEFGTGIADIWIPKGFEDIYLSQHLFISLLAFDFMIIPFSRIIMHASIVKHESEALLFTGPSGMGKSTQAALWEKYKGADILNGDRATLDTSEDIIRAYGSPYAGSSEIYRNESAPVKAIILLAQSKTNSIERLTGIRAYKELFPRFSIVRWDDKLFSACMEIINTILKKTPVYKLSCYPGEEAVDLVYKTLYLNE